LANFYSISHQYIAYPYALTQLPGGPAWSALFFLMLITLGLDSQYTILETFMTAMSDLFPNVLRRFRTAFLGVSCIFLFLIGLTCATKLGGRKNYDFEKFSNISKFWTLRSALLHCLRNVDRQFFTKCEYLHSIIISLVNRHCDKIVRLKATFRYNCTIYSYIPKK